MNNLVKPAVMGIINVSPNSFYNPHLSLDAALRTAERMVAEGADILDVGGEATNPFVSIAEEAPSAQEEVDRVVPVVEAIKKRFDVRVSVDTSRAAVMQCSADCGADIINDQRALRVGRALETVAVLSVSVCLMHFIEPPREPGSCDAPTLLEKIKRDLLQAVSRCEAAGISRERLWIDPGFGQGNFGKNVEENFYVLAHLRELVDLGLPVVSGWSRKSMLGDILGGVPAEDRLWGGLAADTLAAYCGAAVIRTHDVKATVDAMKVVREMRAATFSSMAQGEGVA